jgi:inosine-uridine nucleoside N-ribohydrolase
MLRKAPLAIALLGASLLADAATAQEADVATAREKVILDTDYTTIGDDGQVGIMAAQLHAEGVIDLLGITVVAGNDWLPQEVADALKAVERLGIADTVGVYAGARYPLVHDKSHLPQEKALWGVGGSWYRKPQEPPDDAVEAPIDGLATTARVRPQHAVSFIIETVKKYPHEVTLLVIGPMTNIALAMRMNPEIVPLVKRIVYMAGAFEVPGNTTPAAEMNVWYDPEAARIVVRQPIPQAFIPLDVTDTVPLTKSIFDRITGQDGIVARLFKGSGFARRLAKDPGATTYIYDTLALAYLVDAGYATDVVERWVDVDITWGPSYGRTLGYGEPPSANALQKAQVVRRFDNERFFRFYVDLLTRPVPVRAVMKNEK